MGLPEEEIHFIFIAIPKFRDRNHKYTQESSPRTFWHSLSHSRGKFYEHDFLKKFTFYFQLVGESYYARNSIP